jgi:hypothetical protein
MSACVLYLGLVHDVGVEGKHTLLLELCEDMADRRMRFPGWLVCGRKLLVATW